MRNLLSLKTGWMPLIATLVLLLSACSVSFSTANVSDAWLSTDEAGQQRTTTFSQDAVFYAKVNVRNAPQDTRVRSVWYAVEADNLEPNLKIQELTYVVPQSGNALVTFNLTNDLLWPRGRYKVEIFLNDASDPARTLNFEVR
jgi:hypothetical protein